MLGKKRNNPHTSGLVQFQSVLFRGHLHESLTSIILLNAYRNLMRQAHLQFYSWGN